MTITIPREVVRQACVAFTTPYGGRWIEHDIEVTIGDDVHLVSVRLEVVAMNLAAALVTFSLAVTDARQSLRAYELNPVVQPFVAHPVALVGLKLAGASALTWSVQDLKRHGHPRWAWTLWIGVNAAQTAVVIHNARTK